MRSAEAESRLKGKDGNCYLVRYSDSHKGFMLSVKGGEGSTICCHFKINITSMYDVSEYEIDGADYKFLEFSKLLLHYEQNPISNELQDIGKPLYKGSLTPLKLQSVDTAAQPEPSPFTEGVSMEYGKTLP
jgi:hypothetical protein